MAEERLWGFDDESILFTDTDGQQLRLQDHPELFKQVASICRERLSGSPSVPPAEDRCKPQPNRRERLKPKPRIVPPVDVTLYNQDCISGLHEKVGDATVDLVVTSPPF